MMFAEQQLERRLSRAARIGHELEADRRLLDQGGPAGAAPRLRRFGAVLHDDGKVEVIERVRKNPQ
jgi:hypothetical protein